MADDIVRQVAEQEARRLSSIAALFLLLGGTVLITVGIGWWIHPGAGLAALGVCAFIVGVFIGRE